MGYKNERLVNQLRQGSRSQYYISVDFMIVEFAKKLLAITRKLFEDQQKLLEIT